MAAATSADLIRAARDTDLLDRARALAAQQGIDAATVEQKWAHLVSVPVASGTDDTIASVLAYAAAQYAGRPGQNPAAVTDAQITAVLASITG
jgi:hypothetical protein